MPANTTETAIQELVGRAYANHLCASFESQRLLAEGRDLIKQLEVVQDENAANVRTWRAAMNLMEDAVASGLAVERRSTALREREQLQAFLLMLSDVLHSHSSEIEIQRASARLLGKELDAVWVWYEEYDQAMESANIRCEFAREHLPSLVGIHSLTDFPAFSRQLRAGEIVVIDRLGGSSIAVPGRSLHVEAGLASLVVSPVMKNGRVIAGLAMADVRPRQWTPLELAMLERTAERTWEAVERARVQEDLRASEERLKKLNAHLDERVREQTEELRAGQARLRALALELTRAEQQERKRLAALLHDDVQQYLVAAKLRAGIAMDEVVDYPVRNQLQSICDMLDEAINATRAMARELSPPVLHEQGLGPGLKWLGARFAKQYGLLVHIDYEEDCEPLSESLRDLLFQVARELLLNVVKHANVPEAWIIMAQLPQKIEMVVRDEGAGFDPVKVARSADSFGLLHIHERLKPLGGKLELLSRPGGGTLARVLVPLELAARSIENEAISTAEESRDKDAHPLTILLVDDHQIIREGIRGLIAGQCGLEVIGEACDGKNAVELARKLAPDVIVMDVNMPRMNGVDATKSIHAELPDTRIVGLSLHSEEDMSQAMLAAGAESYLAKDGPANRLIEAIRGTR